MAKPRQRSKQKSGKYTPTRTTFHKTYKKTTLRNVPDELARQWDKTKTLRENYANLGLASNMKIHAVGGVEKELPSKVRAKESEESVDGGEKGTPETMHMGQIIRDDAGNVLEIRMPDTNQGSSKGKSKEEATPWGKPLDATTMETPSVPLTFDDEHNSGKKSADTDAVRLLESKAETARPVGRNTSNDEMKWLINIVKKHGRDLDEACKDLKLNVWQKTKGELSRAVKRAGGFEAVESLAKQ
ncbi:hypothetical protein E3P84_02738 [Wallemia ichthyophaga]|uniref:Nucleolar protein 16 n=1 Tax=Wallemia ichthyophaga TaxID=245174 RepID=A0A4T0IS75_WALIC|nr:hypothetical protein E3P84_02738 [Wallemia ichthyophaga]TIB40725.1 hypothetical protein E3P83_02675 [Wallemia ichthyophaga]TIB42683.1 hypothetical protein E3P86_00270 [Wallemia ichthyophaga]